MLILARRENETIVAGDIRITVMEIRKGFVRLGIVAPGNVPVHREEIVQRIEAAGRTVTSHAGLPRGRSRSGGTQQS